MARGARTAGRPARTRAVRATVVAVLVAATALVAPPATAHGRTTLDVDAPAHVVAGVPFDVTVTVRDRGRPATGYRGTVELSTDDPLVRALPPAHTFTAADAGTVTFTGVTLVGTGRHRVEAQDVHRPRLDGADRVRVRDAGAAIEGQVLSGLDPVEGGQVTVYDAVTGHVLATGPADIEGYHYRITGLPAGAVKVGAVVPGPYEPDFANNRDTLEEADVFVLQPGQTLVQSWETETFGPYLDVQFVWPS
ncbi:hypothetical protein ACFUMH_08600 [Cellulomonas sp. NPDC057328]|uniref:hypothetical protein n=1 Tax=Cellulomonas sp. NPDC057328 TaxID=3346101 RepID=UPI0036262C5F